MTIERELQTGVSDEVRGKAEAFIHKRLPPVESADLPGLKFHLGGPRGGLSQVNVLNPRFGIPYWAYLWGGGLALARFLAERPDVVRGRRVADLGSGSGVVGIMAARAGAASVISVDVDPFAVVATGLNAALNGAEVTAILGDLTAGEIPDADIFLIGDVFYDPCLADGMGPVLDTLLARDVEVLVGDPFRDSLPEARLRTLAEYEVRDFGESLPQRAAVFRAIRAQ